VGNGLNSSFWNDTWKGGRCFRDQYPRLFLISTQKEAKVREVGVVSDQGIDWVFSWRRHLFMWEEEVLLSIKEDLEDTRLSSQEDGWRWKLEDMGVFSVKSAYAKLEGLVLHDELWTEEEKGVFVKLWKCPTPSKVVAFAWRTLLNGIPTKSNLALRHVIGLEDSHMCDLCGRVEESPIHLFLHCDVASSVWLNLMRWLDHVFLTPPNLFVHFESWSGWTSKKNVKKGLGLIWHSTIWVLWKVRNYKIFKGTNFEVDEIVEEIKVLSWRWMLSTMTTSACLFYEWSWNHNGVWLGKRRDEKVIYWMSFEPVGCGLPAACLASVSFCCHDDGHFLCCLRCCFLGWLGGFLCFAGWALLLWLFLVVGLVSGGLI